MRVKEVIKKLTEEKIIETNFSFLFHNIAVSEKQKVAISLKEIAELKDEKGRKVMNLSVNLNAGKETMSVSSAFRMQKELEENDPVFKKKKTKSSQVQVSIISKSASKK